MKMVKHAPLVQTRASVPRSGAARLQHVPDGGPRRQGPRGARDAGGVVRSQLLALQARALLPPLQRRVLEPE